MELTRVPSPEEMVSRLWPVLRVIYSGIELGVGKAKEYFQVEETKINFYLAAGLVRFNARRFIESQKDNLLIELDEIANIGLRLTYQSQRLWILKANDGELPVPGQSSVKQEFYQQDLPFPAVEAETPNMVILWDATRNYDLMGLSLVCPKSGDITKDSVEEYWRTPIPHPATLTTAEPPVDADAATVDDLGITPIARDKAGGDEGEDD